MLASKRLIAVISQRSKRNATQRPTFRDGGALFRYGANTAVFHSDKKFRLASGTVTSYGARTIAVRVARAGPRRSLVGMPRFLASGSSSQRNPPVSVKKR